MRLAASMCLSVAVVVGGCRDEGAKSTREENGARRTATLGSPRRAPPAGAPREVPFHLLKLELVSPGDAPREVLRYAHTGPRAVRAQSRAMITAASAGKPAVGARAMEVRTALALTVTDKGTTTEISIVGLPASGDGLPDTDPTSKLVDGAHATAVLSSRGVLEKLEGAASLAARRELAAMLVRYLVPLPEQAIGVGARWRVKYALARGGVYVAQTITYSLARRDGARLELDVQVEDSAEPQPIIEGGQIVGELVALASASTGKAMVDLTSIVVSSGELRAETTFHAKSNNASGTPAATNIFRESLTHIELQVSQPEKPGPR